MFLKLYVLSNEFEIVCFCNVFEIVRFCNVFEILRFSNAFEIVYFSNVFGLTISHQDTWYYQSLFRYRSHLLQTSWSSNNTPPYVRCRPTRSFVSSIIRFVCKCCSCKRAKGSNGFCSRPYAGIHQKRGHLVGKHGPAGMISTPDMCVCVEGCMSVCQVGYNSGHAHTTVQIRLILLFQSLFHLYEFCFKYFVCDYLIMA